MYSTDQEDCRPNHGAEAPSGAPAVLLGGAGGVRRYVFVRGLIFGIVGLGLCTGAITAGADPVVAKVASMVSTGSGAGHRSASEAVRAPSHDEAAMAARDADVDHAERLVDLALSIPVGLPVEQRLTSPWGMREHPILGGVRAHHGVDLGCPVGTAVLSTANGRVIATGRERGAGLWMRVGHVGGYSTFYAHLSEVRLQKGAGVAAGDTLALSGKSGRVTAAHLHYELNWGGSKSDSLSLPVDALRARREGITEEALAILNAPHTTPKP